MLRFGKYLPLAAALYSVASFASASTLSQISAANADTPGIWVQLCASGRSVFIPLDNSLQDVAVDDTDDDNAAPAGDPSDPGTAAVACHTCPDRRLGDILDVDDTDA